MGNHSKHTAGPWRVQTQASHGPCLNVTTERGLFIAAVHEEGFRQETRNESCANAHLIAAAPDLLDAAQHALARLELEVREGRVDPADYAITMGKLRDAISEATGEQE